MARKLRVQPDGVCFHVVSRIAHREFMFDETERDIVVGLLRKVSDFTGVFVVAYCIMSNHIHLLLFIDKPENLRLYERWRDCLEEGTGGVIPPMVEDQRGVTPCGPALSDEELRQPDEILFGMVMEILKNCTSNDLLIIDDVDVIPGDDLLYPALLKLDCRLILTTASDPEGSIGIQPLPYEALSQIFDKHGVKLADCEKRALIDAVNGHTLAVDLMARIIASGSHTAVTPADLLKAFARNPLVDSPEATDHHLRTLLSLAQIGDSARSILRYGTLIPSQGIRKDLFLAALPKECRHTLSDLLDRGWINETDGIIIFHPVVQTVCRTELKPSVRNCKSFLEALWAQYSPAEYDAEKFRQMAEVFSIAAQELDDESASAVLHAETLWSELGDFQRSREFLDSVLPRYEQMIAENSPVRAQLYNSLGRTCGELGMLSNALEYTRKALEISEKIYRPDHPELAAAYRNVGNSYLSLGNYKIALEYLFKALSIQERILPLHNLELTFTYDSIASAYSNMADLSRALEYHRYSLEIREKVLPPEHPLLAESYCRVGNIYAALRAPQKALEFLNEALSLYLKVLPHVHTAIADVYQGIGNVYAFMGHYDSALEYLEHSLTIYEQLLPPGHPTQMNIRNTITYIKAQIEGQPVPPL